MTGRDVDQGTEKLLSAFKTPHNCALHYHRAGESLLHEAREQISTDLSNVLKLELGADGSEYPNYHSYARTRHVRYFGLGDDYEPLVLIKLYRLLEIMRNASNLRTLILSHHSMDPIFSEFGLPVVSLVNLDELQITGIDYNRNGSLVPLSQSIRCPNLSTLVLGGVYMDVMDAMEHLSRVSQPVNLALRYDYSSPPKPISFHLPSVTSLLVQVDQSHFGSSRLAVETSINAAIRITNHATVLHIVIWSHGLHPEENDKVVECVRHDISTEEKWDLICKQYAELELAGMALTEINIKLSATMLFLSGRPLIVARISSQVLTTLACMSSVLLPILSQHPLPMLNTIQLHVPQVHDMVVLAELRHFDKDITRWIIKHVEGHLPLKVHTVGLSWFPNWRSLLPMLYYMSRNLRDGRDLTVKLPAHPNPLIRQAILLALKGTDDGPNSLPSVPLDGTIPSGVKG